MSAPWPTTLPGRIVIPQLRADVDGFEYLADLSSRLGRHSSIGDVEIDFHYAEWIDAHMLAPLGAILHSHNRVGHSTKLVGLQPQLDGLVRKNGFLSAFEPSVRTPDKWGTIIPYRRYVPSDERTFPTYMNRVAKSRGDLRFNEVTKNSMLLTTLELFNNAVQHGRSQTGVFVCGQYYPNANKMRFALCDLGIGIKDNVSGFLMTAMDGIEAIEWAVQRGHSTRINRPGGMGLHFLKNFIEANNGSMYIVSGDSVVSYGDSEIRLKTQRLFRGTYICLEVNTNTPSAYLKVDASEVSDDLF